MFYGRHGQWCERGGVMGRHRIPWPKLPPQGLHILSTNCIQFLLVFLLLGEVLTNVQGVKHFLLDTTFMVPNDTTIVGHAGPPPLHGRYQSMKR